jgi:hypothetical protein
MTDRILFAGPWLKYNGNMPYRIVLHCQYTPDGKPHEYIVHRQYYGDNGTAYESGNYFQCDHQNALVNAMDMFWNRARDYYHEGSEYAIVAHPGDGR